VKGRRWSGNPVLSEEVPRGGKGGGGKEVFQRGGTANAPSGEEDQKELSTRRNQGKRRRVDPTYHFQGGSQTGGGAGNTSGHKFRTGKKVERCASTRRHGGTAVSEYSREMERLD